jgi:DNA polymerase III alpha subunit
LILSYAEAKPLEHICEIQGEMDRMGMRLLPPDLSKFDVDFTIDGNNIRYGLSSIKGVGAKIIDNLRQFVKNYNNKFELFAAALESGINITVMGALIKSGCLDSYLIKSRSYLLLEYASYKILKEGERVTAHKLSETMGHDLLKIIKYMSENINDKGKFLIKESRFKTFKKEYDDHKQIYLENSNNEDLTNYLYEKEILGFAYSKRLKTIFKENSPDLMSIYEINNLDKDQKGTIIAFVKEAELKTSRKKKRYLSLILEDESGELKCQFHSWKNQDALKDIEEENDGNLPKSGNLVFIKFSKGDDIIFGRYCKIKDYTVYLRVSEYRKQITKLNNKEVINV